jgi:hypothetical protein
MQQGDLEELSQKNKQETLTANGQASPLPSQIPQARPTYAPHDSWLSILIVRENLIEVRKA